VRDYHSKEVDDIISSVSHKPYDCQRNQMKMLAELLDKRWEVEYKHYLAEVYDGANETDVAKSNLCVDITLDTYHLGYLSPVDVNWQLKELMWLFTKLLSPYLAPILMHTVVKLGILQDTSSGGWHSDIFSYYPFHHGTNAL